MKLWRKLFFYFFYMGNPPWDTGITPPELEDFINQHTPGKVLDLGCGTGTNVITLARHGWDATGVDFVGRAIRIARRRAKNAGLDVKFLVDDVTRLGLVHEKFDLVLDIGCFHSLTHQGMVDYANNLPRLLSDNGYFLLYAFYKEDPEQNSGLLDTDLELLSAHLHLEDRQNGTERGKQPSAWFTFKKI